MGAIIAYRHSTKFFVDFSFNDRRNFPRMTGLSKFRRIEEYKETTLNIQNTKTLKPYQLCR